MKPEPIYILPGTFTLAGATAQGAAQELGAHIDRMQLLLGEDLRAALAALGATGQQDPAALISFTGAFTGLSTLLHFCSFTRGTIALERGMETPADRALVTKLRLLLVPILANQCEILEGAMGAQRQVKAEPLRAWYEAALVEVRLVRGFVGQLGVGLAP